MTNTALDIRRLEVEQEVTRMMREATDLYEQMGKGPNSAILASELWDKYGLNDDSSMPADQKLYLARQALDEAQAEFLEWRIKKYSLTPVQERIAALRRANLPRAEVCEACGFEALGDGYCAEHAIEREIYLHDGSIEREPNEHR